VCQHVQHAVLATVKWTLEQALDAELTAYLGAERYEHLPQNRVPEQTRSGCYRRTLITHYALIPDLQVPKLRRGNPQIPWRTLDRYERCWGPLLDQHLLGYCLGLSLRDLQETMRLTLGEVLSLQAVNRVLLALEERVEAFKTARLPDPPPVVLVDGLWVKIAYPTEETKPDTQGRCRAVKRKQKRVILTALGIWPDGHWEILHWKIAPSETAEAWDAFFEELYSKGITEETTHLVVSDGAAGIEEAVDLHLYGVPHQRCVFHKLKNLADALEFQALELDPTRPRAEAKRHAKRARRQAILTEASQIYAAEDEAEIQGRMVAFCCRWEGVEPKAVATFLTDFDKTLSYLRVDFPRRFISLIRTTDLLERFHREVRRKQRDIGMFQSERGCEVVMYLVATRETAKQRAARKRR
jgi:transposase-like protein